MTHNHHEYRVPDRKLVVADLTTADGVITAAKFSGDFFIEPEEAYFTIVSAPTVMNVILNEYHLNEVLKGRRCRCPIILSSNTP